jgi:hypothetical protein
MTSDWKVLDLMKKPIRLLVPLAAAAIPLALMPASAQADDGSNYGATLNPLNHATGSGMLTLSLSGSTATIRQTVNGLASTFSNAPYPHVQHIHIGAKGVCPPPSADKNADGVVNVAEGAPFYGPIGTTLSTTGDTSPKAGTNIKTAPSGGSFVYSRTIQLDAKTVASIKAGTAVIVVHGLDPTTLSKKAQGEKSELVPSLPLAATSPALCGTLTAMPLGGPATGTGSTAGVEDLGIAGIGGGLLALAGGALVLRRRVERDTVRS